MSEDLEHNLSAALRQLAQQAPAEPISTAPIRRNATRQRRWLIGGPVAAALLVAALVTAIALARPHESIVANPTAVTGCSSLHTPTPPAWARGGFSGNDYPPFARSHTGNIIAFIFGNPLSAPPAADHQNKVLWVVRDNTGGEINITATRENSQKVITRQVSAGPSYLNMPTPGCWQLNLTIGNQHDSINLRWSKP